MIILGVVLLGLAARTKQAIPSPCPAVLTYEEKTADQLSDRWYGQIAFPPGTPHWLYMSIILDAKADILGNWLGEVSTQDNTLFRINNPDIKTQREPVRFFVKHDVDDPPPKVKLIKLDEKEICNVNKPVLEPPAEQSSIGTRVSPKLPDASNVRVPEVPYYPPEKVQCGTVTLSNPLAQAVGGVPTKEGQWPWQIALYRTKYVNHNYICGGSLVSHRHVITAAHCTTVKDTRPTQKLDENTLTVYLGKHDLVTSIIGVQIRFVEKITVFPEYNTRTYSRDLSVLRLQEPVQYTGWVQPVCLWPDHLSDIKHVVDRNGSVVGWGNDGSGKLQLVHMPVVSQETCLRSKGDFYNRVTSDYTFCAGMRNGQSTCNGDSGGGMVFQLDGVWHLRGLVSLGRSIANEAVCDPYHFVVFTDLAKFLPWIRENIEPY